MYKLLMLFFLVTIGHVLLAQDNERTHTREGTKLFNKGNYTDAEANYRKALDKKNNFAPATFNLGNAIYKQPNRKEEAAGQFELASKILADEKQRAHAFHNMGNSYLDAQKYKEAVSAYKQALKINPNDQDTKYNLAYANEKLRAQNQNNNNDNKNKDQKNQDKKDDNQDKKNKNDNQDNKDKKENNEKKNQGESPKLSKEAAENILRALQNEEEKTQEKMNKKQGRPVEVKIEKDW